MLTQSTTKHLTDFLLYQARQEKKLETFRQFLCELEDFEPYAAFKRIDRNHQQGLTAIDIQLFLQDNGYIYDQEVILTTIIELYDKDQDQQLNYTEFLYSILPRDNPIVRSVVTQRATYDVKSDQFLPEKVESMLAKLLNSEISSFFEVDPMK